MRKTEEVGRRRGGGGVGREKGWEGAEVGDRSGEVEEVGRGRGGGG